MIKKIILFLVILFMHPFAFAQVVSATSGAFYEFEMEKDIPFYLESPFHAIVKVVCTIETTPAKKNSVYIQVENGRCTIDKYRLNTGYHGFFTVHSGQKLLISAIRTSVVKFVNQGPGKITLHCLTTIA